MGKTALALNIASHVALKEGLPVAIFSLEMSREQLATRLLCAEARVDGSKLRSGYIKKSDFPKLTKAADVLSRAPIFIDDSPSMHVTEMRGKARQMRREHGVELIIIDYLQLMQGSGRFENRVQEISEISRSLKRLAKELNVPVLALSQLNRGVENRPDKRPMLADLRESGAIEQDADVVMFIDRNTDPRSDEDEADRPPRGIAEIIVAKHRNGPTGAVKLAFVERFTKFVDAAREPL
jgi:replicative DNA helicase